MNVASRNKPSRISNVRGDLANKFISEELATKKYSRSQAIAIGLSRAKKQTLVEKAKKAKAAQRKRKQEK
jgi:hypothetical protein